MDRNLVTKSVKNSIFLCLILAMSLLPFFTFTGCELQIDDGSDDTTYVDQSGMRDRAAIDVDKIYAKAPDKVSDATNNFQKLRVMVNNTRDIHTIMTGCNAGFSAIAGLMGDGSSSYGTGVGCRVVMKIANIVDGILDQLSFGIWSAICDIFIPGQPDKETQHYNALMNALNLQDSKMDRMSEQINDVEERIINNQNNNSLKVFIDARKKEIDVITNPMTETFKQYIKEEETLRYNTYKSLLKDYAKATTGDENRVMDFTAITNFIKPLSPKEGKNYDENSCANNEIINEYKEYARKNSCWSYEYNYYMDYFYAIESRAILSHYGIVESLWSPYIYMGNDANGNAVTVPNFNWELYILKSWWDDEKAKNYKNQDEYISNHFFTGVANSQFYFEISDEEYKANKERYDEDEKVGYCEIQPDSESKNYRIVLNEDYGSAQERLYLMLHYLQKNDPIRIQDGKDSEDFKEITPDSAKIFGKGFAEAFLNTFITMGSTNNVPTLLSDVESAYSFDAKDYMRYRDERYVQWQKFEARVAESFATLNNLKKIKDQWGTISCLKTNKIYSTQIGYVKPGDNIYSIGRSLLQMDILNQRANEQGYRGMIEYAFDSVFHGAIPGDDCSYSLDPQFYASVFYGDTGRTMLEKNKNMHAKPQRNGLFTYPSADDYKEIIEFYRTKPVTNGKITFYEVLDEKGESTGYWEASKEKGEVIKNPTLRDILFYQAGISYQRGQVAKDGFFIDGKEYNQNIYFTSNSNEALKPYLFMAEGLNPRLYYWNQGIGHDDSVGKDCIVFENNIGYDKWKDSGDKYAIGFYAICADKDISSFYNKTTQTFEWYNERNYDTPDAVERMWVYWGASDFTGDDYQSSDNRGVNFLVEVGNLKME